MPCIDPSQAGGRARAVEAKTRRLLRGWSKRREASSCQRLSGAPEKPIEAGDSKQAARSRWPGRSGNAGGDRLGAETNRRPGRRGRSLIGLKSARCGRFQASAGLTARGQVANLPSVHSGAPCVLRRTGFSIVKRCIMSEIQSVYNYKVVRQFTVMAVIWGIVGMLVGVIVGHRVRLGRICLNNRGG